MGVRWLADHQNYDGSWNLSGCARTPKCGSTDAGVDNPVLGTALVLLPFLGAGETHRGATRYANAVMRGLKYLVDRQERDGSFGTNMYAHGLATLALCEAYERTGDPILKGPAWRAVAYLAAAQHKDGGWRYQPLTRGDMSVTGWQVEALAEARRAGLHVPAKTLPVTAGFLESVRDPQGGYGYQHPRATPTMTAIALLCRRHTGWPRPSPDFKPEHARALVAQLDDRRFTVRQRADGALRELGPKVIPFLSEELDRKPPLEVATRLQRIIDHVSSPRLWTPGHPDVVRGIGLLQQCPPAPERKDMAYYYHATDLMFLAGGEAWETWNARVRGLLVETQDKGATPHGIADANVNVYQHRRGSWDPTGDVWGRQLGRMGVTALAVLTLEVYYRRAVDLPAARSPRRMSTFFD
jgi:hypothetical protein